MLDENSQVCPAFNEFAEWRAENLPEDPSRHLVVYTCIAKAEFRKSADVLQKFADQEIKPDRRGRTFTRVAFVSPDVPLLPDHGWRVFSPLVTGEIVERADHHDNPRRWARRHKMLPHRIFPEEFAHYSLWMDGTHSLRVNPWSVVDSSLNNGRASFAAFNHPQRSCVFDEAIACLRLRKDDPVAVNRQYRQMCREGFPRRYGLWETRVVVRHHVDPFCIRLCEAWARRLDAGSARDQIALPLALWDVNNSLAPSESPVVLGTIPGRGEQSDARFAYHPHRTGPSRWDHR